MENYIHMYFIKKLFLFIIIFFVTLVSWGNKDFNITIPINGDVSHSQKLTVEFIKELSKEQSLLRQQENDQFFTYNPEELERVLKPLSLSSYTVLEIGSGTGIISNLLIKKGVKKLIISEYDPKISYMGGDNTKIIKGDFRYINFDEIDEQPFGLVANPPYNLLADLRNFIDTNKISNVILIVPAWRYVELFSDFSIVGVLRNKDFLPLAESKNEIHLIIQKGFETSHKCSINQNQIVIGRQAMSSDQFIKLARKKFSLGDGMISQIHEHLGGKVFERLDVAMELLRHREKKQSGEVFTKIQDAEYLEQQNLMKKHKKLLSKEELVMLERSCLESAFAHATWLAVQHAISTENIVIGQRAEISSFVASGLIKRTEVLDVSPELWNWHINSLWIKTAINLKKKFLIVVSKPNELYEILKRSKSGKEFLLLGKEEKNIYIYRSHFSRPAYLGREISLLIDAGYSFVLDKRQEHLVIKGIPAKA